MSSTGYSSRSAATVPSSTTTDRGLSGARGSEGEQHPGVAQGVGLDEGKVEELRDALVVGAPHLRVDLGRHRGAGDLDEAVPAEEALLEGEHEHPLQAKLASVGNELPDQRAPDPEPTG